MASSPSSGASAAGDHHSLISHSPRSARPSRHPWSDIVRGAGAPDLDGSPSSPSPPPAAIPLQKLTDHAVAAVCATSSSAAANPQPLTADDQSNGSNNGNSPMASGGGKKTAWKRPSNGAIEAGPVMGAASWPALSESSKASSKSSSSDVGKPLFDASVSARTAGSLIHDPSLKANENNSNPLAAMNQAAPTRQRSMKRGSNNGRAGDNSISQVANGLVVQQPSQATADKQPVSELSPHHSSRNTTWTGGSGPHDHHGSGDHHRGYVGSHRRGNGGGGSGSPHHGNYGSRRDQDRGGHNGFQQRGINGKEAHIQQRGARQYFRPPPQPVTPPFMPPVGPFGSPLVYPDMPPPMIYVAPQPLPEPFRPMTYVSHPAPPPPMFFPVIDSQRAILLKQIDYYFSPENLCKDIYLRKNMDGQGWVPISLIAGFNRVKFLTDSIPYILDTVKFSNILEVQGERIRPRYDWMNWVLPQDNIHSGTVSNQLSGAPESDTLADRLQTVVLRDSSDENTMDVPTNSEVLSRSASGNINLQSQGDKELKVENQEVAGYMDSDLTKLGRTLSRSGTL